MATDILKRRVYLYPNSMKEKEKWQKMADKKGLPLTKYLIHVIQRAHNPEEDRDDPVELKLDIAHKSEEIKALKTEIVRLNKVLGLHERELEDFRNKAFLEPSFTGQRQFNRDLVELLRESRNPLTDDDIISGMSIAYTDSEAIKSISKQLESMQEYKLVDYTSKGWRWVG